MENEEKNIYRLNLVVLGNSGVGKSSFINRLLGKEFTDSHLPTIGFISSAYKFYGRKSLSNSKIILNIWDSAGQEKYRSACTHIIKKADIIIFIRDNEQSNLEGEDGWINFANNNIKLDLPEKKVFFVLNKTDLIDEQKKLEINEELRNIAQTCNNNSEVFLISSKNSDGIANLKNRIENVSLLLILNFLKSQMKEINICLFGDSNVGKTSLINLLLGNKFIESKRSTLKVIKSEYNPEYNPTDNCNNFEIKFNYYDIPGQEELLEENINIYSKSQIIIFVNDNENLSINYKILERKLGKNGISNRKLLFCINKVDLILKNITKIKKKYMENNKKPFLKEPIFISCKSGEGINKLKDKILDLANDSAEEMNKSMVEEQTTLMRNRATIHMNELPIKNKSLCC